MPAVSFDSLSFLLDGARTRAARIAIHAADFDACLIDPSEWASYLASLHHAGFNAVSIRVPWALHEPVPGHWRFDGALAIRRAVEAAAANRLKVLLRIGPCVGGSFARGGLPAWLRDLVGPRMREADPAFMARVTAHWRALAPHIVDLQASRNGGGVERPIVAVGIEDDWRSLDAAVGEAYFASLVRFAREVGIDVPLFSANNGWYTHEGIIDAWQRPSALGRVAAELRQLHVNAPPMLIHPAPRAVPSVGARQARQEPPEHRWARIVAESIAARADFICEVGPILHRQATSVGGCAQRTAVDLFDMRRSLVFASTFGGTLAGMVPEGAPVVAREMLRQTLVGSEGDRIEVAIAAPTAVGSDAASSPRADFFARDIVLGRSRLEECSASLVASLGDLLVVAAKPRSKCTVRIDGSRVQLEAPAHGGAPRVTKVRGLRVAVVTDAMAAGVGIADDAVEFVDRLGTVLARIGIDGSVTKPSSRSSAMPSKKATPKSSDMRVQPPPPGACAVPEIPLSAPQCIVESGLRDGTHHRFARIEVPASLGSYGLAAMHGYYLARFDPPKGKARQVMTEASRHIAAEWRSARKPRGESWVFEARGGRLSDSGGHCDERIGVLRPLVSVSRLRSVKSALIDVPDHDATATGRFAWGYDARGGDGGRATARWTFPARSGAVLVRLPDWWSLEGHDGFMHALRLNGALLEADLREERAIRLEGSRLSPMRPAPTPKGEKPAKGRNVKLVPGDNELVLDPDPNAPFDAALAKRLLRDMEFLEVLGEIAAEWSFARVESPSNWSLATPVARKAAAASVDAPSWFRWTFRLDRPDTTAPVELSIRHAVDRVATVLVNGEPAMVLDGASGIASGTGHRRTLERRIRVPASMLRAGENEIAIFEPGGAMPTVSLAHG